MRISQLRKRRDRENAELSLAYQYVMKAYNEAIESGEDENRVFVTCNSIWGEICDALNSKFKRVRAIKGAFGKMLEHG